MPACLSRPVPVLDAGETGARARRPGLGSGRCQAGRQRANRFALMLVRTAPVAHLLRRQISFDYPAKAISRDRGSSSAAWRWRAVSVRANLKALLSAPASEPR